MDIAIFGGSFNPVHLGHSTIVRFLIASRGFQKVIIIPAHQNPLKDRPPAIPETIRWQMLIETFQEYSPVEISDFEIKSQGISYSYRTLTHFKKIYPNDRLFLVLGEDSFASFPQWVKIDIILALSSILVFPRPGLRSADATIPFYHGYQQHITWLDINVPDISATTIRNSTIDLVEKQNWLHPGALKQWKIYQQSESN